MVIAYQSGTVVEQASIGPVNSGPGWGVTPSHLAQWTNAHLSGLQYEVRYETSAMDAMGWILAAIAASKPAMVAAGANSHWLVVHGVAKSTASYMVHYRNPLPSLKGRTKNGHPIHTPPHSPLDECLSVDKGDWACIKCGEPGEAEQCRSWMKTFMQKATVAPAVGQYVVVVPSGLTPLPVGARPCSGAGSAIHLPQGAEVGPFAWHRLQASGLLAQPQWRRLADHGPVFSHVRSLRVAALSDPDGAFRLVMIPVKEAGGVLLRLLETTGELLSALAQPSQELLRSLFSPPGAPPVPLPPTASTRLVWNYCRPAFYSPFVPLTEVRVGGGAPFYLRQYVADGVRYASEDLR
ncbi:MAG: hypothetical protein U0Q55_04500 [Vicinamibacterales bacterium]